MSVSSVHAPSVRGDQDPGAQALSDLWKDALVQYRRKTGSNVTDIEKAIEQMSPTHDMSVVVDKCVGNFKKFREEGSKLRNVLHPIADTLSFVINTGSDAASAVVPGAAFVGAAITGLLDATNKVSELYDTIEFVLEQIRDALGRFRTYLLPSIPLTHKLAGSLVESLVVMLHLISIVKGYCNDAVEELQSPLRALRRIMKRRTTDYLQQIRGNMDVKDRVDALQKLTDAQSLQTAAETHANVRELQAIMTYLHNSAESHNFSAWIPLGTAQVLHTRLREERAVGTCEWILMREEFARWRRGDIPLLAILGPAGCGKTTVCTFVIDQLQEERDRDPELPDPSVTLAYFYFREVYNTENENDSLALMNSLVFQLAQASPHCWRKLRKEYSRLRARPLARELLLDMLRAMLELVGPTFVVIDALDECYSSDPRSSATQTRMLEFLKDLYNLKRPNLRLLVMSRPEPSILQSLRELRPTELPLSETKEHRAAIARYVRENLPQNEIWNQAMRKRAHKALTDSEKSQGMFLWVSLQIKHFDRLKTTDEINEALDKLPEGLEQTYRGILQRFGAATLDIQSVLGFIAFALSPLTVADVFAALSFNFEKAEIYSFEAKDRESVIVQQLPGLIEIVYVKEQRIVQFIHFSVKEYLTSDALCRDENMCGYYLDQYSSNLAIATLLFAAFEPENEPAIGRLYLYAVKHWHEHIPLDIRSGNWRPDIPHHPSATARGATAEHVDSALTAFLDPNSLAFESWKVSRKWDGADMPLHCAVTLGLPDLISRLIKQGAECNAFARGFTPLHCAAASGADSCIEALLKYGADPNLTQLEGHTALHVAAYQGHATIVCTLLDAGADIRARTTMRYHVGIGDTPLCSVIVNLADESPIYELLLGRKGTSGLEDICDWRGRTPLHDAAKWDKPDIMRVLLDNGASAHAVDLWGKNPLSIARDETADRCVKLLEEHLKRTSHPDESSPDHTATQGSQNTPDITLYAFLHLKDPTSPADKQEQPSTIDCLVNMGWSYYLQSNHNNCMLTLTLTPHDDESDSVHCVAELYGINADGSTWKLPGHYLTDQSFSLSRKTQEDCCKETAASISRVESSQQHAAGRAVPRLLVHSVPASDLPYHSPMCFPVPPEVFEKWEIPDQNDNAFIVQKLATAAVHFLSCRRHDIESLVSDKAKSDGQLDVEERASPPSDAMSVEVEQKIPSPTLTPIDVAATKSTTSSDAGVAEVDQHSRPPSPSPADIVEIEQTTLSTSASAVGEHTADEPIEGIAAPFISPTSVLLMCGILATAAVLYAGAVRGNPK